LHRLLPPSAIAGVSLVCALTPWVVTDATVLRTLAAIAAATAVTGAVVMRRWDLQAGRQVADLTRARASDEWRFEERIAELEMELEEARELRGRLEQKLRSRRAELTGLRNEHAALLRRYATAETERASALEGRRLLEIEAAPEVPALPAAQAAGPKDERGTGDFALFSPEEWNWLPVAVGLGVTIHILGDVLTTNGAPLLWPVKIRSPRWVRRSLVVDDVWRPSGSFALPLLGSTGSVREWILATAVGMYATVGFVWSALDQMGFDTLGTYERVVAAIQVLASGAA